VRDESEGESEEWSTHHNKNNKNNNKRKRRKKGNKQGENAKALQGVAGRCGGKATMV
jgi:hypothetical protein